VVQFGFVASGLTGLRKNSSGQALSATTACASAPCFGVRQLAAAFLPASLLAGIATEPHRFPPASWLKPKRQQAAALQSFAQNTGRDEFFRSLFSPAQPPNADLKVGATPNCTTTATRLPLTKGPAGATSKGGGNFVC